MDLEDLWIFQSGRFTDSPIQKIYGFPNLECENTNVDPNTIKLPNCIVWNTKYKLQK